MVGEVTTFSENKFTISPWFDGKKSLADSTFLSLFVFYTLQARNATLKFLKNRAQMTTFSIV